MKTVIEMAHEAGIEFTYDPTAYPPKAFVECWAEELESFADLVRADEAEKYKWDVHSCGPTCTKAACVAVREAVKAEREAACDIVDYELDSNGHAEAIKIAIRARSNT